MVWKNIQSLETILNLLPGLVSFTQLLRQQLWSLIVEIAALTIQDIDKGFP